MESPKNPILEITDKMHFMNWWTKKRNFPFYGICKVLSHTSQDNSFVKKRGEEKGSKRWQDAKEIYIYKGSEKVRRKIKKDKKERTKEKMRQTKTRQKDKEKENEINEVRQMRRKTERFREVETRSEIKKG